MKFEALGKYIQQINDRNSSLEVTILKGINMNKEFFPSVANTVGTDMSKYKIVRKGQFAFNPMHVGRDHLVPISVLLGEESVIVSPAYTVFEVTEPRELLPQYLMIWFKDSDFDRRAWFSTDSSVRGGFSWGSLCKMVLPVPEPELQALICLKALVEKQHGFLSQKQHLLESISF